MRRFTVGLIALAALSSQAFALSDSDIPVKVPTPWGNSAPGGNITCPIPIPSQIGVTSGRASWIDGFPPLTFLPSGSGGVPPFGQDFNGVLCQLSKWTRWQNAAAPIAYDATFQTLVGGYPKGATVSSATVFGLRWISLVDNNASNPDTGGANWVGVMQPTVATTYGTIIFGGFPPYDAAVQSALGGYPAGAVVASATTSGYFWRSNVSGNMTNPDASGAGWSGFSLPPTRGSQYIVGSSGNFTVPNGAFAISFELWGSGGGGAGTPGGALDNGAGGSAAWCQATLNVQPGQVIAYSLPTGGAGGGSASNGGPGATATVTVGSTAYTAGGGGGGTFNSGNSGNGGLAGVNCQGKMNGQVGHASSHVSTTILGSIGGSAPRGGVGGSGSGGNGGDPGGGGAAGDSSGAPVAGGNGGAAAVLFTW